MKMLFNIFGALVMGSIALVAAIASLPLLAVGYMFNLFLNWKKDKQLQAYLSSIGNKNFICYSNRTEARNFIEQEIIPRLGKQIEVIYLDAHPARISRIKDNVSFAQYKLRHCSEFPQLLKVRDGKIIDEGANEIFIRTMHHNGPIVHLMNDLYRFFELGTHTRRVTSEPLAV